MSKWPMVPLGEIATVVGGSTPASGESNYWDGDIPWITPAEMGNLESPYVSATRRTLTQAGLASCSARLLPAGSVILSSRAPIGHLVINEIPMATNQGCKGLVPGPNVLSTYLRYALLASVEALNDLGTGATFKEVSGAKVKEFRIPLPPLDEQKRIVAKLDETNEMLEEISRATVKVRLALSEVHRSALAHRLQLEHAHYAPLADVASRVVVGFVGTTSTHYRDQGIPFLRTKNLTPAGLNLDDFKFVTEEFHAANRKSQLSPGDVLMSRVISSRVNVGVVPEELAEANCANVVVVRPGAMLNPEFLAAYVASPWGQAYLLDRKVGSAQIVVNTGIVKNWPIPVLDRRVQDDFVDWWREVVTEIDCGDQNAIRRHELHTQLRDAVTLATLNGAA